MKTRQWLTDKMRAAGWIGPEYDGTLRSVGRGAR